MSKKNPTPGPPPKEPKRKGSKDVPQVSSVEKLEERKASLPLAQLVGSEERFFELVERGDTASVETFLNEHRSMNVNCINYKGLSALHIALKRQHESMVRMLIQRPDVEVRDAALHAVATGNIDFTTVVLDLINIKNPGTEMLGCADSPEYSPDITPLSLAAQNGDYQMVRMLLARGHTLEKPHGPSCLCPKCKSLLREHGSSLSRIRLNSYKAICNPSYICQVTDDPILYSFLLDSEMAESSRMDKEFKTEYEELKEQVRSFTVELIDQCRNTDEVELLLKLPGGFDFDTQKTEFPRLQIALDYKQKEFVAQSMVQQVLTGHWLGEFRSWPRLSLLYKTLHILGRLLLFPVLCILLLVIPWVPRLRKYHSPINRFLLSLSSFLFFFMCVCGVNMMNVGQAVRGPPSSGFEPVVVIFSLGHVWSSIRQFWAQGVIRFIRAPWNWYDLCMHFFFISTFIFWLVSLLNLVSDDVNKAKMERKLWYKYDPTLVHEGLYAIASVLAAGKLGYYCLQSSRLGPLQVSMGKMAIQIGLFLVLFFLIITAFSMPLTRMYAYYAGMVRNLPGGKTASHQSTFTTLHNSITTLFWGMFGMSPAEAADVVVGNKAGEAVVTHDFTEWIGRALFAIYELLMIIALVNTLIAILSNTFQRVVDNADVEFKFHRTKQWMYFFDDSTLLPSPFNLIPSASLFRSITTFFQAKAKKIPRATAKFSFKRCCYVEYEDMLIPTEAYEELMSNLVQRYFRAKEDEE